MKILFAKLRARMLERGIEQTDIARELLRGITYVNLRMNGRAVWPMDEAYTICDRLEIPYEELHLYFPPLPKVKSHKRTKVRSA